MQKKIRTIGLFIGIAMSFSHAFSAAHPSHGPFVPMSSEQREQLSQYAKQPVARERASEESSEIEAAPLQNVRAASSHGPYKGIYAQKNQVGRETETYLAHERAPKKGFFASLFCCCSRKKKKETFGDTLQSFTDDPKKYNKKEDKRRRKWNESPDQRFARIHERMPEKPQGDLRVAGQKVERREMTAEESVEHINKIVDAFFATDAGQKFADEAHEAEKRRMRYFDYKAGHFVEVCQRRRTYSIDEAAFAILNSYTEKMIEATQKLFDDQASARTEKKSEGDALECCFKQLPTVMAVMGFHKNKNLSPLKRSYSEGELLRLEREGAVYCEDSECDRTSVPFLLAQIRKLKKCSIVRKKDGFSLAGEPLTLVEFRDFLQFKKNIARIREQKRQGFFDTEDSVITYEGSISNTIDSVWWFKDRFPGSYFNYKLQRYYKEHSHKKRGELRRVYSIDEMMLPVLVSEYDKANEKKSIFIKKEVVDDSALGRFEQCWTVKAARMLGKKSSVVSKLRRSDSDSELLRLEREGVELFTCYYGYTKPRKLIPEAINSGESWV